ncbi:MAG: flagellar biosynthetic protein FliP [Pseudohongiellaceae bacterium]|jgi:flagellar biosynthetic protein FliP
MKSVLNFDSLFIRKISVERFIIKVSCLALLLLFTAFFNHATLAQSSIESTQETVSALENIQKLPSLSALKVSTAADGSQEYSVSIQILAIMTALSFIPAILLMTTSFTRIIIVFAILRQALGLQQSPSNQILIGMTLFLTLFIMAPVFERVNEQALQPYVNEEISSKEAIERTIKPFHTFMMAQTRESDLKLFMDISDTNGINTAEDVPMVVLIPSFITSELKTAFQIGFIIFIPFLVIDIVVASVLMAMGMMMLSPLIISLPFKIMLFVLVDGWAMLMGTLAASYGVLQ